MRSSVVFPEGILGLLLAYIWTSVWRSAFVPNFAKSELRIVTSLFPGSFMTEVYVSVFTTEEPLVKTSYSPSRLFFALLVFGFFLANFTAREVSVRGTGKPTSG